MKRNQSIFYHKYNHSLGPIFVRVYKQDFVIKYQFIQYIVILVRVPCVEIDKIEGLSHSILGAHSPCHLAPQATEMNQLHEKCNSTH